ncbi:alcohol dehydrogenase catalytic domain-containing protein [Virgibacillus sp. W0181]|uniref:alcohol dehydrogenase catalytic domain-containing protein n=1 Tax=Virgibacillus sp. W0181 TaxID=3391581 RepID=UPI003F4718AF
MGIVLNSAAYRLKSPGHFEKELLDVELKPGYVAVEPNLASVCHADLRYYTGNRRKEALKDKLPMALFHEGIGRVVESNSSEIVIGQRVVIIPNIPRYALDQKPKSECCSSCSSGGADNYCAEGVFLGSGYDGVAQSRLVLPVENVRIIPEQIPDNIAVLTELCSVSLHAIKQLAESDIHNRKIAVFGDGPVGFLTASMLHYHLLVPKEQLIVFGAIESKLEKFDFATPYLIHDFNFSKELGITDVFECTGGPFSESAINQAIKLISRNGKLILLGVTEEKVPVNTRDILEKGIKISGSSRSSYAEFKMLMDILQNKHLQKNLLKLVPKNPYYIRNVADLSVAMNHVVEDKGWKKAYLSFDWN